MKVSVALCTYNGALFIEEQLKSIAQQTRVPDEVIILDDRSTDSTVELIDAVCKQYQLSCAIQINATRLGVEANFSCAMGKTTGDVIFFCDQDDVWSPEKVEKMIAPFERNETVSLVYSDGYIVGPNLESTEYTLFSRSPNKKLQDGDTRDVGKLLRQGRAPGIKASSVAFASRIRDVAGPVPEGVAHDSWVAFWGYALGRVVAIHEPLYYYRRHNQTAGGSSTNKLIPGLNNLKEVAPIVPLREKAHLAQCVYAKSCEVERAMAGKIALSPRFQALKIAAQEAARTLKAREAIIGSSGWLNRMRKGVVSLVKGDYVAIPGYGQKLKVWCQDVGLRNVFKNPEKVCQEEYVTG